MEPNLLAFALALLVAVAVVLALTVVVGYLLVRDTVRRRGRWGLNVRPAACPRCEASLPKVRVPRSFRQALWGGYTCPSCGCEVDKWGREVGGAA